MTDLTHAEHLKFKLLGEGLTVTKLARTRILDATMGRASTPADYASTSGLILRLDEDVWVNAPIADHNPLMVGEHSSVLDVEDNQFIVRNGLLSATAALWIPPLYHDARNEHGEQYTSFAFTHADRVRVSPIEGCSMRCRFCSLSYEFTYRRKRIDGFPEAVRRALSDSVQPASHILISGGTPRRRDIEYVRAVYTTLLDEFTSTPIDIMMAPIRGLIQPIWLEASGVSEVSVNLELVNEDAARRLMPQKGRLGLHDYLSYIEEAVSVLGQKRVRSMLMVGLEPTDNTLEGVRLIAERGGVSVLSPFRPDSSTPLAHRAPPTSGELLDTYLRSREITARYDVPLGPRCIPCTHNTLTLARSGAGDADRYHGQPNMVS